MGIIGVFIPLYNTPATVLLQQKVEPDYLGRVFGVLGMISSIMMPVGMLVFGPLADIIKIEWLLIVTGLAMVALSFFIYKNKEFVATGS